MNRYKLFAGFILNYLDYSTFGTTEGAVNYSEPEIKVPYLALQKRKWCMR